MGQGQCFFFAMDMVFERLSQLEGNFLHNFCVFLIYMFWHMTCLKHSTNLPLQGKPRSSLLPTWSGEKVSPSGRASDELHQKSQVSLVKSHSFSSFGLVFKFYIPLFDSIDGICRNFPSPSLFSRLSPNDLPNPFRFNGFARDGSRLLLLLPCSIDIGCLDGWLCVGAWRPPNNPMLIEVAWWIFTIYVLFVGWGRFFAGIPHLPYIVDPVWRGEPT